MGVEKAFELSKT